MSTRELLVQITVLVIVAALIFHFNQLRYALLINIRNGKAIVRRGKALPTFVERVNEVCADYGITCGWVGGIRRSDRIVLRFSRGFPKGAEQQLRNEWQISG